MTTKEKLIALRKLFSDKRHWTQRVYKRTAIDSDTNRTCYCLIGGLNQVSGRDPRADVVESEINALGFTTGYEVFAWNDDTDRTITHVRERIDAAIKNLGKKNKKWPKYF